MNINELTVGQLKEIVKIVGGISSCSSTTEVSKSHSMQINEKYLIRTVTNYFTGRIKSISESDIVLEDAAWISDTGRFKDAVEKGTFSEVEPYKNDVILNRSCIIDMTIIDFDLPKVQK